MCRIRIEVSLFLLAMRFSLLRFEPLIGFVLLCILGACRENVENTIPPPQLRIDSLRITAPAFDLLITDTMPSNVYTVSGIPNGATLKWYLNVQSEAGLAQVEFKTEQLLNPGLVKEIGDTLSLTGSPITGWNSTTYLGPFTDPRNVNLHVVASYEGQFSALSLILVDQDGLMISRTFECAP